ncbi:hypothetical protein [Dechloromonas sp.]|uniref:hypothetical protein n=1 Tax=Dechloromonas sp. TaxID=1917218 RepID=UPI00121FCC5A|nr:hypothetical protein [Dechloromonas sp.]MBU3696916.1 hypothetical protein [Dechloromonas sp.]TEX49297.1 MAG: hypothetical protein CFR70_03675 [Rhodocyclaceae bacterium]
MEVVDKLPRELAHLIRQIANGRARGHGESTRDSYRKAYRLEKARLSVEVASWLNAGCSVDLANARLRHLQGPARRLEALRKIAGALKEMP